LGVLTWCDVRRYLEMDVLVSSDSVHRFADQLSEHIVCTVAEVRRLFLVEDVVDTLKVCHYSQYEQM